MRRLVQSAVIGLLVGVSLLSAPLAFAGKPAVTTPDAEVVRVNVDFQNFRITITGNNFDAGTPPLIYLGGDELVLLNYTNQEVVAELPADTPSGDYLLQVAPAGSAKAMAKYDLTIGAVGQQGPAGPQGLPGAGLPSLAILLFRQCPVGWVAITPQPSGMSPLVACEQQIAPEPPQPLGLGAISGETGYILADSLLETPSLRLAQIDFGGSEFGLPELALIEQQAQLILGDSNGGSNSRAVAFSYEMFSRAEGGVLEKAGADIVYNDAFGKRTTYLAMVDTIKIGVLVSRAYAYPPGTPYTTAQAQAFLTAKLQDIALSTGNVSGEDAWQKQVLHVFAYDEMHVLALVEAYSLIDAATKADTIVYITRTDGADSFLYE